MVSSITLLSFSGVEKSAAVVIRSASGFPANVWNDDNNSMLGGAVSNQGFEKLTGADADKFTLAGNKLTFIAKAFEARSDNTYRVKIKATVDVTAIFRQA
jgi:hypothetical protein